MRISWQQILKVFELDSDTPFVFGRFKTKTEAQAACDTFRKKLKTAYRKKALRVHPDQGGNQEEFIEMDRLYHWLLQNVRVVEMPPPQPVIRFRVYRNFGMGNSTTTGTTGTTHYRWTTS